jgi:hypothetical protein
LTRVEHSARVVDPKGDNIGLTGCYVKLQDPNVGYQMDIAGVLARAPRTVLQIDIDMCDVSTLWVRPNAFDHVSFNLFFDFKEK